MGFSGLAQTRYFRKRDFEFSAKSIGRAELYVQIEETIAIVNKGIHQLDEKHLNHGFPMIIWEKETDMMFTSMHFHGHLNYHLGQTNYHRRVLDQ